MLCTKCGSKMIPLGCGLYCKKCFDYKQRLDKVLEKFIAWDETFYIPQINLYITKYLKRYNFIIVYTTDGFRFAHSGVEDTEWLTDEIHSLETVESLLKDLEVPDELVK